tara:strand:- start:2938 stop:3354 length:417 start_codon:yes stop_codon:yes gene_type:complete
MSYALVKAVSDNSLKPGIGKRFSDFANDMIGRADGYVDAMDDSFIKKALKVGMGTDANTQRDIKNIIEDIHTMRGKKRMAGREFAAQHPGIVRAVMPASISAGLLGTGAIASNLFGSEVNEQRPPTLEEYRMMTGGMG